MVHAFESHAAEAGLELPLFSLVFPSVAFQWYSSTFLLSAE